jgi:hypothetical protein
MAARLDPDVVAAARDTRRNAQGELSHRRQMARARQRARLASAARSEAAQSRIAEAQARSALRQQETAAKEADLAQRRAMSRQSGAQAPSRVLMPSSGGPTGSLPSSGNPLMLVVYFTVGLALLYYVITHADQFSGYLGRMADLLHNISSTTPLFHTTSTGS